MKLSIIVPVYNVEQYIRPCVQSIYRQGLSEDDFEVILVNDGTQDNSFVVIEDIIANHNNMIVLEQSNQGLSVARNTGLSKASGQYILFLDSDDLLIDNALSQLLSLTNNGFVDMLIAGFVKLDNNEINTFVNSTPANIITEVKSALEIFLQDFDPKQCYVWRTIYRKAFLVENKLRFISGIYFEDVPFTVECFLRANNCVRTNSLFYIYRQRKDSIVSTINMKKVIDINKVIEYLWNMRIGIPHTDKVDKQLMNTIFITFSIAIWYISHNEELLKDRKKFVLDLKSRVPNLKFSNGIKQKIVSFLFKYMPCTYILLR